MLRFLTLLFIISCLDFPDLASAKAVEKALVLAHCKFLIKQSQLDVCLQGPYIPCPTRICQTLPISESCLFWQGQLKMNCAAATAAQQRYLRLVSCGPVVPGPPA